MNKAFKVGYKQKKLLGHGVLMKHYAFAFLLHRAIGTSQPEFSLQ